MRRKNRDCSKGAARRAEATATQQRHLYIMHNIVRICRKAHNSGDYELDGTGRARVKQPVQVGRLCA
jgi:hypothetical protein